MCISTNRTPEHPPVVRLLAWVCRRPVIAVLASLVFAAPTLAASGDTDGSPDVTLARYQARRGDALIVQGELQQRIAQLELQISQASENSAQLQRQLGDLLKDHQATDADLQRLQSDIAGAESRLTDVRQAWEGLQQKRLALDAAIAENESKVWTCHVPIVQIYCLADGVIERQKTLELQHRDVDERLRNTEKEAHQQQAAVEQRQEIRRTIEATRTRAQQGVDDTERKLTTLHAALADDRSAYQSHRLSLEDFLAELASIETLPATERPAVIERRLTRLDVQLLDATGRACQLFLGNGAPLAEPVRKVCSPT